MRVVVKVAVLLLVWASTANTAASESSQCMYREHAGAVVYIKYSYKNEDDDVKTEQGTGFFVDQHGHILTVDHVIKPRNKETVPRNERIELRVGSYGASPIEAVVLRRDPEMDLALLKVPRIAAGYPYLKIGASSFLDVGEKLSGLGFPQSDIAIIPQGEITSQNAIVSDVLKPFWQTSLALTGGHSGSPIFNTLDAVVGVAAAVRTDTSVISFVIPIQYAAGLLKNAGITEGEGEYGQCADFPSCRHPDHGVEKWNVDEIMGEWGGWRGGGYNRGAYCNDLLAIYTTRYPGSEFTKVRDDERNRMTGLREAQYQYYCEFLRREGPVYKEMPSPSCLDARYHQ